MHTVDSDAAQDIADYNAETDEFADVEASDLDPGDLGGGEPHG